MLDRHFPKFYLFLMVGWCALAGEAQGHISAQNSYAKVSQDGKRLLVMVAPRSKYDTEALPPFVLPDGQTLVLRDVFGKSGCYERDALKPIWQVEWYEFEHELKGSPDFSRIARRNLHAYPDREALIFYENGKEIKRYQYQDLVRNLSSRYFLTFTTADYHDQWYEDFEATSDTLTLSTIPRALHFGDYSLELGVSEHYTFDLNTGNILTSQDIGVTRFWAFLVGGLLIVVSLPVAVLIHRWRQRRMAGEGKR
jgi:hypothetical protein